MQQPSPARGPLVWRDLDQKALDDAYNQAAYAPNMDLILGRIAAASETTRKILGAPQRVAYGPSEDERLDIYRASIPSSPQAGRKTKSGAHQRLRPRRSVAPRQRGANRLCRRSDRRRRRARGAHRFHQCRPDRRRSHADGRASGARHRLGLAQRREFWRRPQSLLRIGAFIRCASCGLRIVARLARGKSAAGFLQGRASRRRHVRS